MTLTVPLKNYDNNFTSQETDNIFPNGVSVYKQKLLSGFGLMGNGERFLVCVCVHLGIRYWTNTEEKAFQSIIFTKELEFRICT